MTKEYHYAMRKGKRHWEPREMRMVSEYLAQNYPDCITMTRVRLGPITWSDGVPVEEPGEAAVLGLFRRWADAVIVDDKSITLLEAKIQPDPGVISQLEYYSTLLPKTPELSPYMGLKRRLELIYAVFDAGIVDYARSRGIVCVHFRPPWLEKFLREWYPKSRSPSPRE